MPKRATTHRVCLIAGPFLLLAGFHLRAVETFELSPEATRLLANVTGPSPDTPRGALRRWVIDTARPRHRLTPPGWLAWSCLGLGATLLGAAVMKRR